MKRNPVETVANLRAAFPRSAEHVPICAWDGSPRRANDALCYRCWKTLSPADRAAYYDMDIYLRAQWILDNKPVVA